MNIRSVNLKSQYPSLKEITLYLKDKLARAPFMVEAYRDPDTNDCFVKVFPIAAVRGNSVYADRERARRERAVKDIGLDAGDCLFLTLTIPYNPVNPLDSWLQVKDKIQKFNRKMRSLGMKEYVRAVEANAGGGCHVHILAKMGKRLPFFEGWSKKRCCHVLRLDDEKLFRGIQDAWDGWTDIQVVKDSGAGSYILKELSKYSSCEESLKRYEAGKLKKPDKQRIFTHYFADKSHTRLFSVSKGLVRHENEDDGVSDENVFDLINNKINSTEPDFEKPAQTKKYEKIASSAWGYWPGGRIGVPGYGIFRPGDYIFDRVFHNLIEAVDFSSGLGCGTGQNVADLAGESCSLGLDTGQIAARLRIKEVV